MIGTSRTRSSDHIITDSAAGATAFSCGLHSYNNAIAVDKHGKACGTVLEAAKLKGYATGLVVTSDITDATPASFSAHVANRSYEASIASQQVGKGPLNRTVDLLFGGGLCHFLPDKSHGSCRPDELDLLKEARKDFGFRTVTDRSSFDKLNASKELPILGLFSSGNLDYEIDRIDKEQPSLSDMVRKALGLLADASDKGFFLMIEGSRIDMASHTNDPAAHARDILEYNKAFKLAAAFIDEHGGTLIATSDHETGGVATGRQIGEDYPEYRWYPKVLLQPKHSAEYLARQLRTFASSKDSNKKAIKHYIQHDIVQEGLGIDTDDLKKDEIALIMHYLAANDVMRTEWAIANVLNVRAGIGYSTHGHTAADVLIFGHGDGVEILRGNHENIEIGEFLAKRLDVDLKAATKLLAK
jgi:alkaline phosphatase